MIHNRILLAVFVILRPVTNSFTCTSIDFKLIFEYICIYIYIPSGANTSHADTTIQIISAWSKLLTVELLDNESKDVLCKTHNKVVTSRGIPGL